MSRLVALGSVLAAAGTVHAACNVRRMRRPGGPEAPGAVRAGRLPNVSLLIPARDEAATITSCIVRARAQDVTEILVLDDGSTDGTGALARAAAAADPRVRVLDGVGPEPGWLGKPHACAQLAAAADRTSTVLVFIDADVLLEPGAVRAVVTVLEQSGLDLVSPHPRQLAGSVAERLIQPLLQWSWLTTLPLGIAERSPRPSLSAANGQFLVLRRSAYERAGGHRAVRDAVLDDIALLRALKAAGGHGVMIDGTRLAQTRMYDGWAEVRDGYAKSLWAAFGSDGGAVAVFAVLALTYVVPPLAALRGSRVGALGYLAAVAGRVITARATGGRAWPDAAAHPVSVGLFGYLTAVSLVRRRRGTLRWKGRAVPS